MLTSLNGRPAIKSASVAGSWGKFGAMLTCPGISWAEERADTRLMSIQKGICVIQCRSSTSPVSQSKSLTCSPELAVCKSGSNAASSTSKSFQGAPVRLSLRRAFLPRVFNSWIVVAEELFERLTASAGNNSLPGHAPFQIRLGPVGRRVHECRALSSRDTGVLHAHLQRTFRLGDYGCTPSNNDLAVLRDRFLRDFHALG